MKYDGVSKVVFLGEPCSGVKSFVSSFISTFAQSVFVDKKQLFISKVGRDAPLMDIMCFRIIRRNLTIVSSFR